MIPPLSCASESAHHRDISCVCECRNGAGRFLCLRPHIVDVFWFFFQRKQITLHIFFLHFTLVVPMEDSTIHVLHQSQKGGRGYCNSPLPRIEVNWKSQLHKLIFPAVCFESSSQPRSLLLSFLPSPVFGFWITACNDVTEVSSAWIASVLYGTHLLQQHKHILYWELWDNRRASFRNTNSTLWRLPSTPFLWGEDCSDRTLIISLKCRTRRESRIHNTRRHRA